MSLKKNYSPVFTDEEEEEKHLTKIVLEKIKVLPVFMDEKKTSWKKKVYLSRMKKKEMRKMIPRKKKFYLFSWTEKKIENVHGKKKKVKIDFYR